MGLAALPYVLSAAGALGGAANQMHARKKQDNALAEGIRKQGQHRQDAAGVVNRNIDAVAASDPNAARAKANQQLMETLQRNRASQVGPAVPGASDRYAADVEQGNTSVGDFGSELGGMISSVDSAQRQREAESQGMGRAADVISQIQRRAQGDANINALRVQSIQPNPWVALASGMVQNIGTGMAKTGGAGKAFGGKIPTGAGGPAAAYPFDPFGAGTAQVFG
jgi:hypothetical protein